MEKSYSNQSNARRAAKAAGLKEGEFTVYKEGAKFVVAPMPAIEPTPEPKRATMKDAVSAAIKAGLTPK